MALNIFDQFAAPTLFGIPLYVFAILVPWLLYPTPAPRFVQNRLITIQNWLMERFVKEIFGPVKPAGQKWALMYTSVMIFIVTLNLIGLLPYTYTPTAQLSLTLGLAFPLWLATVLTGLRNQPTATIAHLLPEGTPTPLIPFLIIIETISLLIRPLALGVRLAANITAGHLLIQLVSTAVFVLLPTMPHVALLAWVLLALLTILEVAVAIIQAYVFVLLLSLYLQENL
uniref:ATP synthase subunit a n=1 Tax=Pelates quadrilineatus TaxID=546549 RepID=A0A343YND9_9TELE|nr:ATP synthase subunit 6 [Pelates quadrilineatus]